MLCDSSQKDEPLLKLWQLCIDIRPSLWSHWNMHCQTKLSIFHNVSGISGYFSCTYCYQHDPFHNFKVSRQHKSNRSYHNCFYCRRFDRHSDRLLLYFSPLSGYNQKNDERGVETHQIRQSGSRKPMVRC